MPNITMDNHSYDLDTLSDEARAQLQSLQFVDAELQRLNAQTAVPSCVSLDIASKFNADDPRRSDKTWINKLNALHDPARFGIALPA